MECRNAAAAGFLQILEVFGAFMVFAPAAYEKNIEKSKKIVCILEKMGYNKV